MAGRNIYQDIWYEDQKGNGLRALKHDVGVPRETDINAYRYKLNVHPGATPKNMRTFFPELVRPI